MTKASQTLTTRVSAGDRPFLVLLVIAATALASVNAA